MPDFREIGFVEIIDKSGQHGYRKVYMITYNEGKKKVMEEYTDDRVFRSSKAELEKMSQSRNTDPDIIHDDIHDGDRTIKRIWYNSSEKAAINKYYSDLAERQKRDSKNGLEPPLAAKRLKK